MVSSAGTSPTEVRAAAQQARLALGRRSRQQQSFLSGLDYVCTLAGQLESTLGKCAAALAATQRAETKMSSLTKGAPSEEMQQSVDLVSPVTWSRRVVLTIMTLMTPFLSLFMSRSRDAKTLVCEIRAGQIE